MVTIDQITAYDISAYQRLLVLAPHEDDETLGAGGVIQIALQAGMQVKVVMETNGDGSKFGAIVDYRNPFPNAAEYVRMGETRQKETLAALALLGISSKDVIFLGYPDRGTGILWIRNWSAQDPFHSPFTTYSQSPYQNTYNPQSVYAGEDLLKDLGSIIQSYQPDLIIIPHPEDFHPDHWGLSNFVRLAIRLEQVSNPGYKPVLLAYLVHRNDYPIPAGYLPNDYLEPPAAIYAVNNDWVKVELSEENETLKNNAILEYKSQLSTMRKLLESFVRKNELFTPPQSVTIPHIAKGDANDPSTWQQADGSSVLPFGHDPVRDSTTRVIVGSGDIAMLYAGITDDQTLHYCMQLRANAESIFSYILQIKSFDGMQFTDYQSKFGGSENVDPAAVRNGKYICTSKTLAELNNPVFLMAGAEVQGEASLVIDRSAWQLIEMGK